MTKNLFFYTLDIDSVDSEQVYKQINNNYDTLSVLSFQNNIDNIKEKIEIKNQHFSNTIEIIEERENQLTNKIIADIIKLYGFDLKNLFSFIFFDSI